MNFRPAFHTVTIGIFQPRPGSLLRTCYSYPEPVRAGLVAQLAKRGGIKRTDGCDIELCYASQSVVIWSPAFREIGSAIVIRSVDGMHRSAEPYLMFRFRQPSNVHQNAFSRSSLSTNRRARKFATAPSRTSRARACAKRMQKERVKMMNVAACASVGRGPRSGQDGHHSEGGSDERRVTQCQR